MASGWWLVTRNKSLLRAGLLSCFALWLAPPVHAQTLPREVVQQRSQEVDHLFNWYYASVFGTGVYKIGEESVAALRLPFAYTFRKATDEQWGLRLTVPVTAAVAEFDLRDFDLGRVSTVGMSIVPGLEAEVRLFEVLGVGFDRIGIGYRRGSNGLRGVRLVGSFPF